MKPFPALTALVLAAVAPLAATVEDATIRVHPNEVISHVTRYMTGACLEDVNHEVYGGIYSQMIFGESFQEPPPAPAPRGFTAYGGRWLAKQGIVAVEAGPGPLLIAEGKNVGAGDEIGVEVFLPGKARGVAGVVLNVREPAAGADAFIGYEIALSSEPQFLRLGRHRHNWEPIQDVPCTVPTDRWIALAVRLEKEGLEVLVEGKSVLRYVDREHPLDAGGIGLRTFNRAARFRKLWLKRNGATVTLPIDPAPRWDEGVSGIWRGVRTGTAAGSFSLTTDQPFLGRQSQRIVFEEGTGEFGIENRSLNHWGMSFVQGKPYEGVVWLRAQRPTEVIVALESGNGAQLYAKERLQALPGSWQRQTFTLTPDHNDRAGRFALKLDAPGSVDVGYGFLQPGAWGRFKGLPVRKDVGDALVAQGLTVLRYGGSMVNAPEYNWKNMIGDRERRPPYKGFWYPYSTNGWGILDFLDFCEAAGFLAVPAFHLDESPQDMADFVEYVNGPAKSRWGKVRVANGHPTPYRLKHLEFGNEETVDADYWRKFKAVAEAIWARDPDIVLVVGDFAYNDHISDPFSFRGAPRIKSLAAHQKILELARTHGREVWFDVHVWNHEPRDPARLKGGILGLGDFGVALKKLCPGADFKVCVFEENATNHKLRRGLAHAHALNALERRGDLVPIVCAANCLQPDRQNDNGWDQGLVFLNPSRVWAQPSYYVTQMISQNYLPKCVRAEAKSAGDSLDVTAKVANDGKVLQLQVVNLDSRPRKTQVDLGGFAATKPNLRVIELAGRLEDENTAENPRHIVPRERTLPLAPRDGRLEYSFPAYSFAILRLE
jgi:alpha-L-arabinofuranosidase